MLFFLVLLKVPIGTIIKDKNLQVVGDLNEENAMFVAARGGAGGHGNSFFCSDSEQSPQVAEYGAEGESMAYTLEIKSMAHFGLVSDYFNISCNK